MKIRLPSSLTNASGHQGIENVDPDDIGYSSDSSSSNRSVLSLLRSRSRSRSRSRARRPGSKSRTISFRETIDANATTTSPTKKQTSPTGKIMKRLQKSFSSPSSLNRRGQSHSHQDDSFDGSCSDSGIDSSRESDLLSTGRSLIAEFEDPIIDSAIASIADRAVAMNFPSSYIRPVPIKPEDVDRDSPLLRRDPDGRNPTRPTTDTGHISTAEKHDDRSMAQVGSSVPSIVDGANLMTNGDDLESHNDHTARNIVTNPIATSLDKYDSDTVTKTQGEVLVTTEMADEGRDEDEADGSDDGIDGKNLTPTLATDSKSLLPPLADEDESSQKLLLPATETTSIEIKLENEPEEPSKTSSASDHYIVTPSPRVHQTHVFSPMSAESCHQSRNNSSSDESSVSISRSRASLVLDYDDGSSIDHIANLTKSAFQPPREVVTITLGPVLAAQTTFKTPAIKLPPIDPAIEDQEECKENSPLRYRQKRSNDGKRKHKNNHGTTPNDVDDDEEKRVAQELAIRLGKDLEKLREEAEKYASKNRRLESQLQILKAQQEEHLVHRGRLVKACLYTAPVFVLCGGFDAFLATILLVWVLVEVDGYLDGPEGHEDGDDEDEENGGDGSEGDGASDSHDGFDDGSSMDL